MSDDARIKSVQDVVLDMQIATGRSATDARQVAENLITRDGIANFFDASNRLKPAEIAASLLRYQAHLAAPSDSVSTPAAPPANHVSDEWCGMESKAVFDALRPEAKLHLLALRDHARSEMIEAAKKKLADAAAVAALPADFATWDIKRRLEYINAVTCEKALADDKRRAQT